MDKRKTNREHQIDELLDDMLKGTSDMTVTEIIYASVYIGTIIAISVIFMIGLFDTFGDSVVLIPINKVLL